MELRLRSAVLLIAVWLQSLGNITGKGVEMWLYDWHDCSVLQSSLLQGLTMLRGGCGVVVRTADSQLSVAGSGPSHDTAWLSF